MPSLLTRLLTGGAAYQASSIAAAVLAVVTLPLYTRALSRSDFGIAETLLTFIILASILLRFGLGEAFVRFWFDDEDPDHRRSTCVVGDDEVRDEERPATRVDGHPGNLEAAQVRVVEGCPEDVRSHSPPSRSGPRHGSRIA